MSFDESTRHVFFIVGSMAIMVSSFGPLQCIWICMLIGLASLSEFLSFFWREVQEWILMSAHTQMHFYSRRRIQSSIHSRQGGHIRQAVRVMFSL